MRQRTLRWIPLLALALLCGCSEEPEEDQCDETFVGGCDGNVATWCLRGHCGFGPCGANVISEETCSAGCVEGDPVGRQIGTVAGTCEMPADMGSD